MCRSTSRRGRHPPNVDIVFDRNRNAVKRLIPFRPGSHCLRFCNRLGFIPERNEHCGVGVSANSRIGAHNSLSGARLTRVVSRQNFRDSLDQPELLVQAAGAAAGPPSSPSWAGPDEGPLFVEIHNAQAPVW